MKLKKLVAALGMALSLVGGAAQAQTMIFQDDDIDFLLNADLTPKTTGSFAPGDILVSVFEIPSFSIGGVNGIPAGMELTGVAAVQLEGGTGTLVDPFRFAPVTQGFNAISPVDVVEGGAGEGATVAMFLNSTADFDLELDPAVNLATNCTSFAQCLDEATAGTLFQVDGFAGDADEFWTSTLAILGGSDVDVVAGLSNAVLVATFQAAQTTFFNAPGTIGFMDIATGAACPGGSLAADGCVAGPTISGPLTGGAGLNPALIDDGAFARSDFDARKLMAVPEPGVLALVGLGFIGMAMTRRRRT
jgi:hypothetical protein